MGSRVARQLEAASHVPPGWLDDATSSQVHWLGDQASDTLLHTLGPGAEWIMPLVDHRTPAGFPSPAADYETTPVNLLSNLQLDQAHTFMARISGQSMVGKGIDDGDLIVINRSLTPKHGHTVVALLDNELTCKTLYKRGAVVKLQAANPEYPDIVLKELQSLTIWGVVTSVIKPMAY